MIKPVSPSVADQLTKGTKEQILAQNLQYQKLCK